MTSYFKPVLNGSARSDYENYLLTDQLLSLQKGPDEWKHRDELLFTVVHQASELWLKLATSEVLESLNQLKLNNLRESLRLLGRAALCIQQTTNGLEMLEKMSPWDYQQVRRALGHGSGFDSPGFNSLRKSVPGLGFELSRLLEEEKIDLLKLFLEDRKYEDLFQLAIVDEVIAEPSGGAHGDPQAAITMAGKRIAAHLEQICALDLAELLQQRYAKYRRIGRFEEQQSFQRA